MPTRVEVPGHGIVEFPDGMDDNAIASAIQKNMGMAAPKDGSLVQGMKDLALGQLTSAQRISSTLMTPVNKTIDYFQGNQKSGIVDRNRAAFDKAVAENADPNSAMFKTGKITGDIGFTMPIGGLASKPLAMVAPKLGAAAPYAEKLANAIKSGGFNLGGAPATTATGSVVNGLTRVAGGAINGGISAGSINPDDAALGAGIGAAFPVVGKVASTVGKGVGSVVKPLYQGGKNKILADFLLDKSGNNTDDVINNLRNAKGNTPGFNPTVGQASNSPELATVERVFRERNPNLFGDVTKDQNKALAAAINGIGGDDIARQGLVDSRESAVKSLYEQAKKTDIPIDPNAVNMMQRPAIKQAISEAKQNAMNRGNGLTIDVPSPTGTIGANGLPAMKKPTLNGNAAHEIKMALDAAKNQTAVGGANKAQLGAIGDASNEFNSFLENAIPAYGQAKTKFADMSQPINQLDVGNAIRDKYIPALYRDLEVPPELRHAELSKILQDNGDKLAQSTTGFKGATLEGTLRPDQLSAVKNAVKDAQFIKQGQLSGKPINSSTFQNLAFDGQMGGVLPDVLKNFAPASVTGNVIKAGRDLVYKGSNEQLAQQLAEALVNPQKAAELMSMRLTATQKSKAFAELLKRPELVSGSAALSAQ